MCCSNLPATMFELLKCNHGIQSPSKPALLVMTKTESLQRVSAWLNVSEIRAVSAKALFLPPQLQSIYKADSGHGFSTVSQRSIGPLWTTTEQQLQPDVGSLSSSSREWCTRRHADSSRRRPVSGAQSKTWEVQVKLSHHAVTHIWKSWTFGSWYFS